MSGSEKIKAYKAFDSDLKCLDFQYEVGKSYTNKRAVEICKSGFHACEIPFSVLNYKPITGSRFGEVAQYGDIDRLGDKAASSKIDINTEIGLPGLIKAQVEWVLSGAKNTTTGADSHSATAGNNSHSATTGADSHSATAGRNSVSCAIGRDSNAKAAEAGAIVLANYREDGSIRHIRASKVGENGVLANTWYRLNDDGEFEVCE